MDQPMVSPMMWFALAGMLALLVITAVAAISFNLRQHGKLVAQFEKLADKFGLELTVPEATMGGLYRRSPTLYGHYQGHEISVFPKGYGLDNTRQTDTAVRVSTRAGSAFQFSLAPRNMTGKLGQLGRLKEMKTGDEAFDQKFSLRTNEPDRVRQLFSKNVCADLLQRWPPVDAFLSLHDGVLMFLQFGLPYEDTVREQIEPMIGGCISMAEEL